MKVLVQVVSKSHATTMESVWGMELVYAELITKAWHVRTESVQMVGQDKNVCCMSVDSMKTMTL